MRLSPRRVARICSLWSAPLLFDDDCIAEGVRASPAAAEILPKLFFASIDACGEPASFRGDRLVLESGQRHDGLMLSMRLKRAIGPYPAGGTLLFAPATARDVNSGDVVLAGLDEENLLPHLITEDGSLRPFAYIIGEHRNIKYRAVAVTSQINPF